MTTLPSKEAIEYGRTSPTIVVNDHQPYLMAHSPKRSFGIRVDFGIWVECECGWIGPSCSSDKKALASHEFHEWLAVTYPKGIGLEPKCLRAKCWVLADVTTGEQASPKAPASWPDKKTALRALAILQGKKTGIGTGRR